MVADEEVDGNVGDGEKSAKGTGDSFQALHGFFVLRYAVLDLREASGLPDTHDLLHLAL
jgi:hypothetical protein